MITRRLRMPCLRLRDSGDKMSRRWSDGGMVDPEIKKPIISPMLSKFLRRRFMELLGVLLLLLGSVSAHFACVRQSGRSLDRRCVDK